MNIMGKMVDSKEKQKKEVISSMITIHHDDCLNAMKQLPDDHVDFVFADLPYGTTNNKWDVVLDLDALWDEYERVVKTNGAIVLSASQPFTSQLVMSKPEWFKYEWIWEKQRASNFMRAKHEPLKYHENILVFSKGNIDFQPQRYPVLEINEIMAMNKTEMNEMMKTKAYDRYGTIDRRKTVRNPDTNKDHLGSSIQRVRNADDGYRNPKSVLKINKKLHGNIHPTQKPVELVEYLIRSYTNENDVVLDNTMGSGSTGIACINTNRQFIGMEKDSVYYEQAKEWLSEHQKQVRSL